MGAAHSQVYSKVHHANGAVVPDDTLSVKVAKAQHLNAKATAYLKKTLVHALLPQVAAAPALVAPVVTKKVVQVAKPVVSYHGLTTPLVYSNAALTHPVVHNNVLAYNGLYNNFNGL